MKLDQRSILIISFIAEGALVCSYFAWAFWRGVPILGAPTLSEILLGLLCTIPLFVVNYLFFGPFSKHISLLKSFSEFKDEIVWPLARALDTKSALVVAILAGVGEELFFRGVLQTEFGLLAASILFSLLHFGPAVRNYTLIAIVYFGIGIYFGLLKQSAASLWVPIIAHMVYDFAVLLYLRRLYEPDCEKEAAFVRRET